MTTKRITVFSEKMPVVDNRVEESLSENRMEDELESRVMYLHDQSKKSMNLISKCFEQQSDICHDDSDNCFSKLDSCEVLDRSIRNAAELSFVYDRYKESVLKKNSKSLIRTIDPFGDIPHIKFAHGLCRSVVGGSMHVIFQFLISIEKAILVPVTLSNLSFKLLLDSYGQFPIDLTDLELEIIGMRSLVDMSSKFMLPRVTCRDLFFKDFIDLLTLKIGVPSFFQFTLKQLHTCSLCSGTPMQSMCVSKYFLKLDGIHLGRDTCISE